MCLRKERLEHIANHIKDNYLFIVADFSPSGEFSCRCDSYLPFTNGIYFKSDNFDTTYDDCSELKENFDKAFNRIRPLIIEDINKLDYVNYVRVRHNLSTFNKERYFFDINIKIFFQIK